MTILMTGGDKIPEKDFCSVCGWPHQACQCDDFDDELDCTWCGGEGIQDNDDPLWHGFDKDWIPCECCAGTGLRKHQTIF